MFNSFTMRGNKISQSERNQVHTQRRFIKYKIDRIILMENTFNVSRNDV